MNQVLLYSINPEHLANILNGHKTIEVRKRDLPQWAKDKLAKGEKVVGYGYCTKGGKRLAKFPKGYVLDYIKLNGAKVKLGKELNGLVVVKFEVSGSDKISLYKKWNSTDDYDEYLQTCKLSNDELCDKSCLSNEQLEDYLTEALGYAHHFTNIQPIKPMELSNLYKQVPFFEIRDKEKYLFEFGKYAVRDKEKIDEERKLTKSPQSFMTCWVKEGTL